MTPLRLVGADLRINGEPVAGLENPGDIVEVPGPNPQLTPSVTGTLADGTPFVFTRADGDLLRDVTFELAELPAVGPAMLDASTDDLGVGLRRGQTLVVPAGAAVRENYVAGLGSKIVVEAGGSIGENFEAGGARIDVRGGTINADADLAGGSRLHLYDGEIGEELHLTHATLDVFGGTLGGGAEASTGATINVYDGAETGSIGTFEGVINVRGGDIDNVRALRDGKANITGGNLGAGSPSSNYDAVFVGGGYVTISGGNIINRVNVLPFSTLHVYGSEFFLGDDAITLDSGESMIIENRGSDRLTTLLADGTPLELSLFTGTTGPGEDVVSDDATLIITNYLIGDFNGDGLVDLSDRDTLQSSYGMVVDVAGQGADGNFNGIIDAADFTVWRDAYDASLAASVPEPTSIALATAAVVVGLRWRARS